MNELIDNADIKFINKLRKLYKKSIIKEEHWLFPTNSGHEYGKTKFKGEHISVHRLSAHIFLGLPLKERNHQALHKITCPYKNCWNPNCLYIGNASDNQIDRIKLGTFRNQNTSKIYCNRGHELTKENIYKDKYGRHCKKCRNITAKIRYDRTK